jgi:hypothetical protein
MADDPLARAFTTQSGVCASFGSPFYAALTQRVADDLDGGVRALFAPWDGQSFEELMGAAVSLRFLGAVHDLALSGDDPALTAAFPPASNATAAWAATKRAIRRDPGRFSAFMAHEPQTNEVRRSACLLPGFLTVAAETGLPLACLELGASAGLNQLWSRYRYDYGAAGAWGDPAAPLGLTSDWTGPTPPWDAPLTVANTRACDRKPIDVGDPAQRRRLKAYLWPDQTERIERFDRAVAMALAAGERVEAADAADWALANAAPREGVTTTVFHSVFWLYMPTATRARLTEIIEAHGAQASDAAPLAWLRMEPAPGQLMPIELRLRMWPGGRDRRLAVVQAHGATIAWEGPDFELV